MRNIPKCKNFLFVVTASPSQIFLLRNPTAANSSCATWSYLPSRLVLSAIYCFQSSRLDSRSLIRVKQQSIGRSHCSGPLPCLLMMLRTGQCPRPARSLFYVSVVLSSHPYPANSAWFLLHIGSLQRVGSQPRLGLIDSAPCLY
jgi:hypothetical protein